MMLIPCTTWFDTVYYLPWFFYSHAILKKLKCFMSITKTETWQSGDSMAQKSESW